MSKEWSTPVKEYIRQNMESLEKGNLFEFFGNASVMLDVYYKELVEVTNSIGIDSKQVRKQILFDRICYFYIVHPETRNNDDTVYKSMTHMGLTLLEFHEVLSKAKVATYEVSTHA